MGTVRELKTTILRTLDAHTLIGRAPHCVIRIEDDIVSGNHAALHWEDSDWKLRDLNSKNGTWVDGRLLPGKGEVVVRQGSRIAFGSQNIEWELCDALPPEPMVTLLHGGTPCLMVDGVITVPNPQRAVANICRGRDGNWTLECGDSVTSVVSGEVFSVDGASWRFSCPAQWQPTAALRITRLLQGSTFRFDVTSDEESVALTIESDHDTISLGRSSAFYFLLTLARLRAQDEERRPGPDVGWVHRDQLVRMLRCDPQLLNVWVCRIRSKLNAAGFADFASVVERVDGSGRLRIGVSNIVVRRE